MVLQVQNRLRLLDASAEDHRSELLQCKVFSLLMGEMYRSHGGSLFEYVNGVWKLGHVSSVGLEFLLLALRRAQAYFTAMSQHKPMRTFEAISFELQAILAAGDDCPLLEWQLNDVVPKKLEARAKVWLVGLSELCRSLRHTFSEHNKTVVKNYHRWSEEDLAKCLRPGLCFTDAYISTGDGQLQQYRKDPRHGCYVGVPCSLAFRPGDAARARYSAILVSSFAGSDELRVLLDQAALVVAGVRQPDVLHVVVGHGHDGKTLIFVDHMRSVFGSGFGCCPCSMLQTEREFQQQGLSFIHCSYMVFDESKREQGIMEDQMKLFVGGGRIPLRRNHEAETKYAQWSCTGKVWAMNMGDIPHVPTALERSHARRYRCTFMRSQFINDGAKVDVEKKIFLADPAAKAFMAGGEAVWSFFNDYLFPHMKAHGIPTCSDNLEFVKASSVTARDTAWLLDRMARVNDRSSPDVEVELLRAQAQGQGSVHKDVVQETHQAIAQVFFSSVGLSVCLWTYVV